MPAFKQIGEVEKKPGQVYLVYSDGDRRIEIPRDLVKGGRGAAGKVLAGKPEYLDDGEKRAIDYYSKFPGQARYAGAGAEKHFETRTADGTPYSYGGKTSLRDMQGMGYATKLGPTMEEFQQGQDDEAQIAAAMAALDKGYDRSRVRQAELTDRRFDEDMRAEYRPNDPPIDPHVRNFTTYEQHADDVKRKHFEDGLDVRHGYADRLAAERAAAQYDAQRKQLDGERYVKDVTDGVDYLNHLRTREQPPTATSYRAPTETSVRRPTDYGPKTTFVDDMLRRLRGGR